MQTQLESLRQEFQGDLQSVRTTHDLENLSVKYLGRKGPVQELMKFLKDLSPEERPAAGQKINQLKEEFSRACETLKETLIAQEEAAALKEERLDITVPGRRRSLGNRHLLSRTMQEILDILIGMGFTVQYGPDIDTDYYNFEALNFAEDHPARDMQDTFYLEPKVLLRTHTTNIQARVMEAHQPPLRIVSPGKVYRNETVTARSHVQFHQIDPLYIDKGVTFADLLSTLEEFLCKLFNQKVETRFRPSYFPFVEPGLEVDVRCVMCGGHGCSVCKHSGWLEVLGAGMVHPEVLKNGGIDPEVYSGFAWGMGLERSVMLRYGIKDIRYFTENDLRFLQQFTA